MNFSLDSLLFEASSFISSEFNLQIQKSQLKPYSPENWQQFCQTNGFNVNSEGIYIPTSYSAYVRTDSPVLKSNIFHELYGHGLFVEHSKIGKKLIDIIQSQGDERGFLFGEVNPKKQFFGIAKHNLQNYEGFAVWLEALLCEETGNSNIWKLKKNHLPRDYAILFEHFQDAEQKLSRFGLMSQMGFQKFYDEEKISNLVRKVYGSSINNIDFVLLRGSQKPKSDIDLFVVSSNPSHNFFNGWLDIYEVNREEFFDWSEKLDLSITDPMFSGNLIYGDEHYFQQMKQRIQNQPITQDAIDHHLEEIERLKHYQTSVAHEDESRKKYIRSFSQNAEQLQKGNKALTLQNLKQLYEK